MNSGIFKGPMIMSEALIKVVYTNKIRLQLEKKRNTWYNIREIKRVACILHGIQNCQNLH